MSTRSRWFVKAFAAAALSSIVALSSVAQNGSTEEGKRKVKTKVAPVYPDLARRMNVTGKVKLELVITAEGRVKSVRALGGHPILVQACQEAVKDWKFMPAAEESTQMVEFNFNLTE